MRILRTLAPWISLVLYLLFAWGSDRWLEAAQAERARTFQSEPLLWTWVGLNLAFAGLTLALFLGLLRWIGPRSRWLWGMIPLGLLFVGLGAPPGFQLVSFMPDPLRAWLGAFRVSTYLAQAAAFITGMGIAGLLWSWLEQPRRE
ncbi:hypothetical protein [Thermoflexus sp.]|uniref:hypothetical protein n=1 Tax=Thermoflexus sp. TaxID=1969742 RepID=UPI0035E3FC9A